MSERMTYIESLKVVAAPLATIAGLAGVIFWFAADAWVRGIVEEEVSATVGQAAQASVQLQAHAQTLEHHADEIEENEDTIKAQDERFTEFVRELLDRL